MSVCGVTGATASLLERHEQRRAFELAAGVRRIRQHLGEPEIQDLDQRFAVFAPREKQVFGLEIAVNDRAPRSARIDVAVCLVERGADLPVVQREIVVLDRSARFDQLLEMFADQKLHCQKGPLRFGVGADVEDAHHVLARDSARDARFETELLHRRFRFQDIRPQHFERDFCFGVHALGGVNRAESTFRQEAQDAVAPRENLVGFQDVEHRDQRKS